jgi:phenylacetate-CoA ligase
VSSSLLPRLQWSAYAFAHAQLDRRLPWQDLDHTLAIQGRRVRRIVRYAWERVPFYQVAMRAAGLHPDDFHTADDLARLPLVDSKTYAASPALFRPTPEGNPSVLAISSSGTTGQSKVFHHDIRSLVLSLAHGQRQRHVRAHFTGGVSGYRELSLVRENSVSCQIRRFYETHLWTPKRLDILRRTIAPGARALEEEAAEIHAFRPDVIVGYGSYLGTLFRKIRQRGLACHVPRVFVYGAEAMPEVDRAFLEQEIGAPVLSSYQSTEALRIGFQCELRDGFHLSLDDVAVRVIDHAGRDVAPGETGEVVISNLTNTATILLNYRLGDLAVRGKRGCPCGRTLPLLESIAGRRDDLLHLSDGRSLHALVVLFHLRRAAGLDRIQVVQEEAQHFHIYAVEEREAARTERAARLAAEMDSLTASQNSVQVEWVEALPAEPSGKTRTLISKLGKPNG